MDFECPYCGYEMEGFAHFDMSQHNTIETECQRESCGRKFILERDFDVTYSASPIEETARPAKEG